MSAVRVVPARRQGRESLCVRGAGGRLLAWYDSGTGRVDLLSRGDHDAVLAALAPYLTGPVTVGPPPVPGPAELARLALPPDDDLAPNRPGEALLGTPARPRRLRLPGAASARRAALAAEQSVGAALDGFEGAGWRTLHSLPLPGGDRVHHLLIGPGGLYTLYALPARGRAVRIATPLVGLGGSAPAPLLDRVRADAERASHALAAEVRAALVLVDPGRVEIVRPPLRARVLRATELPALAARGGELKPADVEGLFALARDRHTWLDR